MGKTYVVQSDWFTRTDHSGQLISTWCKKLSATEVTCFKCNKKFSCVTKGFASVMQHSATNIHVQKLNLGKNQMHLIPISSTTSDVAEANVSQKSITLTCNNSALNAELIWAMKTVMCNWSANSSSDIKDVFQAMFPGQIPEGFSLGYTKLSYLITEALGPYFFRQLVDEIKNSYYSILFDETVNDENKKELQVFIRFFSEKQQRVMTHNLAAYFLGHAKAHDLVLALRRAISSADLSVKKLLMIGSDGPNVNKSVKRILNDQIIEERGCPLIDVGSCSIHIVHNAFLKGLEEFGDTCTDLLIDVYYFFKGFPSRQEDFEEIQKKLNVPSHKFIKHVQSRWLTVAPACERLLEQWPALEEYFFKFIPMKAAELMNSAKYKQIAKSLRIIDMKAEIGFVIESAAIFTRFTEKFQKTEPLIHILYEELIDILRVIAGRVCKKEFIEKNEKLNSTMLLPVNKIDCGILKKYSLKDKDKLSFLSNVQKHYVAAYNYLLPKILNYKNGLLPYFKCLQPAKVCKAESVSNVAKIAEAMPFTDFNVLLLKDEWRLLQLDTNVLEDDYKKMKIDKFWANVIGFKSASGDIKYPLIAQTIKAALCLSHGNSDVERGFSLSGRILTEDKSRMSEKMLNCRLWINSAVKNNYDSQPAKVPITNELARLGFNACRSYKRHLEEQRKIEEEKLQKKKKRKKKFGNDQESIRVAQGLLYGAEELRKKGRQHEEEAKKINKAVHKRKSSLLDEYFKNPKVPKK